MKILMTSFAAMLMLAGVAHATGSAAVTTHSHSGHQMQHCPHCMKAGKTMKQAHACPCCKGMQCSKMNGNSQPMMMHNNMQDGMMHQGGAMGSQEMMHDNMQGGMMQPRSPQRH
jgi:hypothetical protein